MAFKRFGPCAHALYANELFTYDVIKSVSQRQLRSGGVSGPRDLAAILLRRFMSADAAEQVRRIFHCGH